MKGVTTDSINFYITEDSDNDGMPDEWEIQYGLDPLLSDGLDDLDGDGISNIDEFFANTDPTQKGFVIRGRVTDTDGRALSGVVVEAWSASSSALKFNASTGRNGFYVLPVTPAPDYRVMVWQRGAYQTVFHNNAARWGDAALVDAKSSSVSDIDFILTTGMVLGGQLSGLEAGDRVTIEAWSPSTMSWGATSLSGTGSSLNYGIQGLLPANDYEISVNASGYIGGYLKSDTRIGPWEQASRFTAGGSPAHIQLEKGLTISGRITGLQAGEKAIITARSRQTDHGAAIILTSVGGSDDYILSGLHGDADDYQVAVIVDSKISCYLSSNPNSSESCELAIDIRPGEENINFQVTPGASISGNVSGLGAGEVAVIDAWSESTWSGGGAKVTGNVSGSVGYTISGLPSAGDYRVRIWADGYRAGFYSSEGIVSEESAEKVDATKIPQNINFTLKKAASISGLITGLPRGGKAHVEAWSETEKTWGGTSVFSTGEPLPYTISGLTAAKNYTVRLRPDGYAEQTRTKIDSGNNPTSIHFVVSQGRTITGTVTGDSRGGVALLTAKCASTASTASTAVTLSGGFASYTLTGLGVAADCRVTAVLGNSIKEVGVDLSSGDRTVDFAFPVQYAVSGMLLKSSGTPPVVRVTIWNSNAVASVIRPGNGTFSMELPAGSYQATFQAKGYQDAYFVSQGVFSKTMPAQPPFAPELNASLGTLDMSSYLGYTLSGKVTLDGAGLADVFVEAVSDTLHRGAYTDARGRYEIDGLEGGSYAVRVWSLAVGSSPPQMVTVGADITLDDIALSSSTAQSIQGVVVNGEGNPMNGAVVLLFDTENRFLNARYTDVLGGFSFKGLDGANDYILKVDADGNGVPDTLSGGRSTLRVPIGTEPISIALQ